MGGSSNLERTLTVEVRGFDKDKGDFLDLGHPLLNRIAESFVKAACIRAIHAVSRDAYFAAVDSTDSSNSPRSTPSGAKSHPFPRLKGETNSKSLEVMVKNTGKETLQWGLAAGIYSGLTYGLKEARGAHDWKNSAVAGAVTGMALALTSEETTQEQVVHCAITGAAISTAANLLKGIF
ncbi:hypothetical protein SLEP1_g40065 [Rubroshorea leprosula]|uniref:Outer envelope pore protein 16-2, chloroplastic n=1 Tax=Rubroshorea leprosula TaxID=152421 RepID=A0AAV5L2G4_9ROSI|nr:hypothetical protein SLEP1_g40065 [Rubroshorea leprosula]